MKNLILIAGSILASSLLFPCLGSAESGVVTDGGSDVPEPPPFDAGTDAGPAPTDAGTDVIVPPPFDAGTDAGPVLPDAETGADSGSHPPDAASADGEPEADSCSAGGPPSSLAGALLALAGLALRRKK